MKKKIWLWILCFVVFAGGGGAYYYYQVYLPTTVETVNQTAQMQTAISRKGDIVVFATGVGSVIPSSQLDLGFSESGTVTEILVKIGEEVKTGQVLAKLQTKNTEETIAASIAEAELNVLNAQLALDALYENAPVNSAQALIAVENTQKALDDLSDNQLAITQTELAVFQAEEALATAQQTYNNTLYTASQSAIDAAKATLVIAKSKLDQAKERYAPYADKPDEDLVKASMTQSLSSAQSSYDSALRNFNAMTSTASPLERNLAKAALDQAKLKFDEAQKNLETAKAGPTAGQIALAEANMKAAQATYETLKDGQPDPDQVALKQTQLANVESKLELAKETKTVVELTSPIDGTIMDITTYVGTSVGTGSVMTVADLVHPRLTVSLDETDLDQVKLNDAVEVVFDAFPDLTFKGTIIAIYPKLVSSSGFTAVRAIAQLDPASFVKPITLPVGLSASVDVIGGRALNAVLVPVEAIRDLGGGQYAVFVIENGEPTLRLVTVGLQDITSAEILSGLEPGEVVSTGIVQTSSN